jgi:hypothetical protein
MTRKQFDLDRVVVHPEDPGAGRLSRSIDDVEVDYD